MKSAIYAALGASLLSSFATVAAAPQSSGSGLTHTVPPPPCLYRCIQKFGDCAICTPDGDAKIRDCFTTTCEGPPNGDYPYAGVYYNSICPEGGYLSYATDPPKFITIPPANCPS
ncbi:MAG: hypothetical protein LQ339_002135 [Xanthoria mediterranea]|nr:MAG: hypothetical protein LQ339_002135 [Xanthoria mediterranea]